MKNCAFVFDIFQISVFNSFCFMFSFKMNWGKNIYIEWGAFCYFFSFSFIYFLQLIHTILVRLNTAQRFVQLFVIINASRFVTSNFEQPHSIYKLKFKIKKRKKQEFFGFDFFFFTLQKHCLKQAIQIHQ